MDEDRFALLLQLLHHGLHRVERGGEDKDHGVVRFEAALQAFLVFNGRDDGVFFQQGKERFSVHAVTPYLWLLRRRH